MVPGQSIPREEERDLCACWSTSRGTGFTVYVFGFGCAGLLNVVDVCLHVAQVSFYVLGDIWWFCLFYFGVFVFVVQCRGSLWWFQLWHIFVMFCLFGRCLVASAFVD